MVNFYPYSLDNPLPTHSMRKGYGSQSTCKLVSVYSMLVEEIRSMF